MVFFIGIPPQITIDGKQNDDLQNFNNSNSFVDKLSEIAKQTSIFGRSYLFLYQNEHSETKVAISSPRQSFMIYDDTVAQEPLYFVRYSINERNSLVSGTIYTSTEEIDFTNGVINESSKQSHLIGGVPAVEFIENEERQGAFESVKSIMNEINAALSQKANDVEAIADAYLFLKGAELDEEAEKMIADKRMIGVSDKDADAKFLERPNGDGTQENLLNRLEEKLFLTSMVTNLNNIDSGASSSASGYSIELRMQAMRGLASNKERKFTSSMRNLYRLVFNLQKIGKKSILNKVKNTFMNNDPTNNLEFKFTRNLPKNIADEANTAKTLEGIVSKKTQLGVLSFVTDPASEIQQMIKEQNDTINNAVENSPNAFDFQKNKKLDDDDDEE